MATIASMIYNIEAQTTSIEQSMKNVASLVDNVDKSMLQNIVSGNLLSDAFEKLGGIAVGALEQIAGAFPVLVSHTIDVGNSLYEMSLKTGASVENLSALRYVASQTGIDFDSFGTTLYKMEQALGSTGAKADALQGHLDVLGLSLQTLKNEKPDEAFIDIMSALEAMPNRADQAAIGMALFGKGFKEMAGLTQESITDLIKEANDLGLVMSTGQAAAAHAAEIGWKSFTMQLEAGAMSIATVVLPGLVALEELAKTAFTALSVAYKGSPFSDGSVSNAAIAIGESLIQATAAMAGFGAGAVAGLRDVVAWAVRTGEAFINIADVSLKVGTLGTVDEAGKTILDKTAKALHGTYDALEALKSGFNSGADVATAAFVAVQNVADGMAGKFGAAYTSAAKTIQDFSDKSHGAFGGVGADVDTNTEKTKAFDNAWEVLNSTGADVFATMANLTDQQIALIRYYVAAKDPISDIATGLGLEVVQVQSVIEVTKALKAVEDDKNVNSLRWLEQLGEARQVDGLQQLRDTTTSIDQTRVLWANYYDTLTGMSLSTVDKQKAAVQKWLDDETLKLKADDLNWQRHYEALVATAQAQTQQIIQANDPLFKSWQKLNIDMQGGWQDTFANALSQTHSFTDAAKAVFQAFEADLIHIFADLLTNIVEGFLKPFAVQFGSWLAGVLGVAGGSGGGGGGSLLGGIIAGIIGGHHDNPGAGQGDFGQPPTQTLPFGPGAGELPGGSAPGAGDYGLASGGYATAFGVQHFAFGGFARGTDTVPAMLTPGEMVLTKRQQRAVFGSGGDSGTTLENTTIIQLNGREFYRQMETKQTRALRTRRKMAAA